MIQAGREQSVYIANVAEVNCRWFETIKRQV